MWCGRPVRPGFCRSRVHVRLTRWVSEVRIGGMRKVIALAGLFLAGVLLAGAAERSEAGDYQAEIEGWRAARVAALTRAAGWLALRGTQALGPGENTIGSATGNRVVLESGPARLGVAAQDGAGRVTFAFAAGVAGEIDGAPLRRGTLKFGPDAGGGSVITAGSIRLYSLDRGGQKALRVWDSAAPKVKNFAGLDYFPVDPAWRIEARWEPFTTARFMPVPNSAGQTVRVLVSGRAVFECEGRMFALLAIDEGMRGPLHFVIADATSGGETYGACRFLYAERPQEGSDRIVLDFNRAENPPCAFTALAACPLPPPENRLPLAVRAGEKVYRGAHE